MPYLNRQLAPIASKEFLSLFGDPDYRNVALTGLGGPGQPEGRAETWWIGWHSASEPVARIFLTELRVARPGVESVRELAAACWAASEEEAMEQHRDLVRRSGEIVRNLEGAARAAKAAKKEAAR